VQPFAKFQNFNDFCRLAQPYTEIIKRHVQPESSHYDYLERTDIPPFGSRITIFVTSPRDLKRNIIKVCQEREREEREREEREREEREREKRGKAEKKVNTIIRGKVREKVEEKVDSE
jgi:hypothetical protein